MFLTKEESAQSALYMKQISIVTQFVLGYYNFWIDTILAMLVPLTVLFNRSLFYEEPLD